VTNLIEKSLILHSKVEQYMACQKVSNSALDKHSRGTYAHVHNTDV
jgi:hypothetical protein